MALPLLTTAVPYIVKGAEVTLSANNIFTMAKEVPTLIERTKAVIDCGKKQVAPLNLDTANLSVSSYFGVKDVGKLVEGVKGSKLLTSSATRTLSEAERNVSVGKAAELKHAAIEAKVPKINENSKLKVEPTKELAIKKTDFYSSYTDRVKQTPNNGVKGQWSGERGESKFSPSDIPENKSIIDGLKAKGLDGINYKNANVDFSSVAEETVRIPNMTNERKGIGGNFEQAYSSLADKFNANMKDGKTNWTPRDVTEWAHNAELHDGHKLIVHERADLQTCDFVRSDIHSFFNHFGGVGEYNAKVNVQQFNKGGFDE